MKNLSAHMKPKPAPPPPGGCVCGKGKVGVYLCLPCFVRWEDARPASRVTQPT